MLHFKRIFQCKQQKLTSSGVSAHARRQTGSYTNLHEPAGRPREEDIAEGPAVLGQCGGEREKGHRASKQHTPLPSSGPSGRAEGTATSAPHGAPELSRAPGRDRPLRPSPPLQGPHEGPTLRPGAPPQGLEPGVTPWTDPQPPITLGGPAPSESRPVSSPANPPLRQPQRGSTSPSGSYPSCLPQALAPVPTLPGSHGKLMPSQRRGPPGMFPCQQAQPCDPSANELRGDLPGGSGKACPPWLLFFLP